MGTYGGVKPHVAAAGDEIGRKFGIRTIGGVGTRAGATDHDDGLALDFMCNLATGTALAAYVKANATRYRVTYIIHRQRIWSVARASEGWRMMEDRGSPTANHMDHVHVSFAPVGGPLKGTVVQPAVSAGIPGAGTLGAVTNLVSWVTDPKMWLRVAMFLGGGMILLVALVSLAKSQSVATAAKSTVRTVAKVRKP